MPEIANEGKSLRIEAENEYYDRIPIKTHVITDADKLEDILVKYVKPILRDGDIVFMSEKAVACTQKRAVRMKDIKPRPLAVFLSRFVYKTPYGIGLGIPETMEMALVECGTIRILFAALVSFIGKLFGQRGWFYIIAGDKARSIDGPCDYTLPPYNEYVVLGPLNPEKVAREAAQKSGIPLFTIVDLNDLGGNILGVSDPSLKHDKLLKILRDNPLGQASEQTPIGIIRKADDEPQEENNIRAWLENNLGNVTRDLARLVKIRSVAELDSEVKPFGEPCREALDEMQRLCEEHGFGYNNHDYYCATSVLKGTGEKEIGLFAHLDVVPESGEWVYPPFEGQIVDGFMIGRGVADNKNAAIAALYIMKYFKENNIGLKTSLCSFFGCCEEKGMHDIENYITGAAKLPDCSIIIDSIFPVVYCEKGIIECNLNAPLSGMILELNAGLASNMVPDKAFARLKYSDETAKKLEGIDGVIIADDKIEVSVTGKAGHAAYPEGSVNAIQLLSKLLLGSGCLNEADQAVFEFLASVCGDYTGKPLGVDVTSEEYGSLTCVGSILSLKDEKAVLKINIRYPYGESFDEIIAKIKVACDAAGFSLEVTEDNPPCCVSRDSDFVKTLMSSFTEVTGESLPEYIMAGGTYARKLPCAVAFGPEFPESMRRMMDLPEGHGSPHTPDEALNLDEFLTALEIYIRAIIKLQDVI